MKNLDKYLSLLGDEVDGLLLTSRYSRRNPYAVFSRVL